MSKRPSHRRPTVSGFEYALDDAGTVHTFTPNFGFDAAAAGRAIGEVGHLGYAVVRTQASSAQTQLEGSLRRVLGIFDAEIARIDGLDGDQKVDAEAGLRALGHALHWEAIDRVGIHVENLATLLAGWDCYRKRSGDVGEAMLSRDLDLLKALGAKERRKLDYWEALVNLPAREQLLTAGLSTTQARVVRAAYRTAAMRMLSLFEAVRAYYIPGLHSVYTKRKHGYTLLDPAASPLRFRSKDPAGRDLQDAMRAGFAVVHRPRDGLHTMVYIVKSDEDELRGCVAAAADALILSGRIARGWLTRIEHSHGRSMNVEIPEDPDDKREFIAGLQTWFGAGYGSAYSMEELFAGLEGQARPDDTEGGAS